jgi:hypothetical protein
MFHSSAATGELEESSNSETRCAMFSVIYVTLPTPIVQAPSKGLLHRKWHILHKALSPHFFPKKFQTKCSSNAPLVTHIGDSSLGWLGLNSTWAWKLLYLFLLNTFNKVIFQFMRFGMFGGQMATPALPIFLSI